MKPHYTPIADYALLVTFGDTISDEVHESVVALDRAIEQSTPAGVIEVVPAMVNLLVTFDPVATDHTQLEFALRELAGKMDYAGSAVTKRTVQVCYDAPYGPDLTAVADACNLDEEGVIAAHLSGDYKVLMYGFAPGYAYMGGVPDAIQVPRKRAPVRDIAAGVVLIAGPQCLVTTLKMPTGWSIIGQSPTQVLIDDPTKPAIFDIGDEVKFERIDKDTFESINADRADE